MKLIFLLKILINGRGSVIVNRKHLNYLFKNNYTDGVLNIIKDYLPLSEENYLPLKSFDQKDNTIFIYQKTNG